MLLGGSGGSAFSAAGSVQSGTRGNYEASKLSRHFPRSCGPGDAAGICGVAGVIQEQFVTIAVFGVPVVFTV